MSISFSIHYLSMWLLRYSAYGIQMDSVKMYANYRGNSGDVMGDITNNIQ